MDLIGSLFYVGLGLAIFANVLTFVTGDMRNRIRRLGMGCAIVAAISVAFAGHLANQKVAEIAKQANAAAAEANKLTKFLIARGVGGGL